MKSLRVWLLLVLIAVLPLRGNLAATVLCHESARPAASADAAHPASHGGPDAMHEHTHLSMADTHAHPLGAADKCSLCAGLAAPACPTQAASPMPVVPIGTTLVVVPTLWPASFVPAKLERPPRTT